jgi:tetratricopeptide (TPR) repeat protein
MEAAYRQNLDEYVADIAHHLYQAGAAADLDKTVRFLMMAGDQAQASAAFEDALRHLESAASLASDDPRVRADLMSALALARRSLGRWDEAMSAWRDALSGYESLGDADAAGRIALLAAQQLTWVGRFVESTEMSDRGLAVLGDRKTGDRACLLARTGLNYSLGGFFEQGVPMLEQGLELADELADDAVLAPVLYLKATQLHFTAEVRGALELYPRAIELLERTGSVWDLANALGFLASDQLWAGRLDEAERTAERAQALADKIGNLGAVFPTMVASGFARLARSGEISDLESTLPRLVEIGRTIGSNPIMFSGHAFQGRVDFWHGQWDAAADSHLAGAALETRSSLTPANLPYLFLTKAYAGDQNAAEEMLDELTAALPQAGRPNGWGAWNSLGCLVEGLVLLGRRDEAATLYPLTLEAMRSGRLNALWDARLLQSLAGIAAAAGGDFAQAEEHFETALGQAHEIPIVIEQPETQRLYAGMLINRGGAGDRERARNLLAEASQAYAQIGMPRHRQLTESTLGSL